MFSLEAFWASQTTGDTIKRHPDVFFFHPSSCDWPTDIPWLLSCRRWDPCIPKAVPSVSLSNAGGNLALKSWIPKPDSLKGARRAEQAHLHQPLLLPCSQTHMSSWLCRGSMQAISPQCLLRPGCIQCTAQANPFPCGIWTEPQQQCPGSDRWPSLHCSPCAELTQDERHQMTGFRVPRAGSRGFFCRHLAGCFKVFCL